MVGFQLQGIDIWMLLHTFQDLQYQLYQLHYFLELQLLPCRRKLYTSISIHEKRLISDEGKLQA